MLPPLPLVTSCTVKAEGMGLREELEHKDKKKNTHTTPHTHLTPDFQLVFNRHQYMLTYFIFSIHFAQASRYKYIQNINMTTHERTHSSNVFTWHQKWKLHTVHTDNCKFTFLNTKWTHYRQRCNYYSNNKDMAQKE